MVCQEHPKRHQIRNLHPQARRRASPPLSYTESPPSPRREYAVEIVVKRRGIKNLMQANKSLRYSHNVLDKKAEVTSINKWSKWNKWSNEISKPNWAYGSRYDVRLFIRFNQFHVEWDLFIQPNPFRVSTSTPKKTHACTKKFKKLFYLFMHKEKTIRRTKMPLNWSQLTN